MQWAPAEAGVQVMAGTHGDAGRLPPSVEEKKTQSRGRERGRASQAEGQREIGAFTAPKNYSLSEYI